MELLINKCECGCGEDARPGKRFIYRHNMRGKHHSEETKQKMRASSLGQIPWSKGLTKETNESVNNMSKALTGRVGWSKGLTKTSDPRVARLSQNKVGIPTWSKGLSKETDERMAGVSESHKRKWEDPEFAAKMRSVHADPVRRGKVSIAHKKMCQDPAYLSQMSLLSKKAWAAADSKKRDQWVKNCRLGLQCVPNKPEATIQSILEKLHPGEWKFVGDGQVIIAGKNPDFINVNGQKKIIELYGDYWHKGQDPQDRINTFKPFGFETLVIWEHELKNMENVKSRIQDFHERKAA